MTITYDAFDLTVQSLPGHGTPLSAHRPNTWDPTVQCPETLNLIAPARELHCTGPLPKTWEPTVRAPRHETSLYSPLL